MTLNPLIFSSSLLLVYPGMPPVVCAFREKVLFLFVYNILISVQNMVIVMFLWHRITLSWKLWCCFVCSSSLFIILHLCLPETLFFCKKAVTKTVIKYVFIEKTSVPVPVLILNPFYYNISVSSPLYCTNTYQLLESARVCFTAKNWSAVLSSSHVGTNTGKNTLE